MGGLRERGYCEDLDLEGRKRLKCVFKKQNWGVNWINVAEDKEI